MIEFPRDRDLFGEAVLLALIRCGDSCDVARSIVAFLQARTGGLDLGGVIKLWVWVAP